MFRNYDWMCDGCASKVEYGMKLSQIDNEKPPEEIQLFCRVCEEFKLHARLLSLPAPYMGEKVCNPQVHGGKFDTMGEAPVPSLPELPAGSDTSAYRELFQTAEYKEVRAERDNIISQNKAKKKRAAALAQGGTVNMRNDKLPGDPKVTA